MRPTAKIAISLFLISLFSSVHAMQTTIPSSLNLGFEQITANSLKPDLAFLASNQLQGRLSLTAGDDKAAQRIAHEFKAAGLKPLVGNRYLQAVPLVEYVPNVKKSYIAFARNGEKKQWHEPNIFTDFPNTISLSGPLLFAGYGITAPGLHYDDYQNIDARHKIVLIFEHEPQELDAHSIFNGKGNTIYATTHTKVLNAQEHGAIAVFIVPEPNRKHPSNQERYARIGGITTRKTPLAMQELKNDEIHIPSAVLSDAVAKQLVGTSVSLSQLQSAIDQDLKPRSQLIPQTIASLHDENTTRREGVSYNVVGLLEGGDPILKHETIIISAHHDHDGASGKQIWHGADDNASGTTGVIALARALTKNAESPHGMRPKRSIMFVVFAAEERGLLGAYYMAKHPLRPLATTKAMLNFDMIGRNEARSPQTDGLIDIPADTTNRLNIIGSHFSPEFAKTIHAENQSIGLILDGRFDNESALNTFFRSDQFPFVLHNIPAFWWFTGFHPDYHHTTDTADKINYPKMAKILQLAYLTTYQLADEEQTPTFIKDPQPH